MYLFLYFCKKIVPMENDNLSIQSGEGLVLAHNDSAKNSRAGELFNCYLPLIYGVCLKYLKDTDRAEDAIIHLFENLHDKIADYETATFRSWIYGVTKNYCLQIMREEDPLIPEDADEPVTEFDEASHPGLWNYIQGKRYGEEAQQLEAEARYDHFLYEAIEGYDSVNDNAESHLKKLRKQITKRTKKSSNLLQVLSIAAGILLIIGLSIFFFLHDIAPSSKKTDLLGKPMDDSIAIPEYNKNNLAETEPAADSVLVPNNTIDSTSVPDNVIENKENVAVNNPADSHKGMNQSKVRQKKRIDYDNEDDYGTEGEEPYETAIDYYTLSTSKVPLHNEYNDYTTQKTTQTIIITKPAEPASESVSEPISEPVTGNKAYKDYIENNRKQLTEADYKNQHGKVILMFKVDGSGHPADIAILRSLCQAADQEAVRLLRNGPPWTTSDNNTRLEITF